LSEALRLSCYVCRESRCCSCTLCNVRCSNAHPRQLIVYQSNLFAGVAKHVPHQEFLIFPPYNTVTPWISKTPLLPSFGRSLGKAGLSCFLRFGAALDGWGSVLRDSSKYLGSIARSYLDPSTSLDNIKRKLVVESRRAVGKNVENPMVAFVLSPALFSVLCVGMRGQWHSGSGVSEMRGCTIHFEEGLSMFLLRDRTGWEEQGSDSCHTRYSVDAR
jgi:hypothetical protein